MLEIDGVTYDRVYVCELEPGMVNAFGETVSDIERIDDNRTRINWTNGQVSVYGRAESIMLIDVATINE